MKRHARSEKGQVLIIVAIALVVLLAMVGLAVDVGIAYGVKAKLYAAVDAAAIEAGKVISQGTSVASTQATNFFNANYPSGYLGSTVSAPSVNSVYNSDGSYDVTVNTTAKVPTYFARVLGWNDFSVNASATTHIRTLDLVLVLDTSGSLDDKRSPGAFQALQDAASGFINNFDANNYRIGLIHFSSGYNLDYQICNSDNNSCSKKGFNKNTIKNLIKGFSAHGATTSEEAMRQALDQLDSVPEADRSSLRVIVFFTDGAPNGVSSNFDSSGVVKDLYSETNTNMCNGSNGDNCNYCLTIGYSRPCDLFSANKQDNHLNYSTIATLPSTGYGGVNLEGYNKNRILDKDANGNILNTWCNTNKAARNMLENVANTARSESGKNAVTIYTIGFGTALNSQEVDTCIYGNDELGKNILKRLANIKEADTYNPNQPTGLYVPAPNPEDLGPAFQTIANQILRLSK